MFELTTPTPALLKSVTPRQEHHGDEIVVALSMRLEINGPNTLLDTLSPTLRKTLYTAVEGQDQLPGVEPSTPLLRCKDIDLAHLKACFEGWTLKVDHGIEEDNAIALGGCKVDSFKVEATEGGSVKLTFRVGTNDVSPDDIGILCGKLGSEISITLEAPQPKADAIDGSQDAFYRDHPGAGEQTDLIGDDSDERRDGADRTEADDPLLDEARELVQHAGTAAISSVQRKLRIGYNRAARLLEALEAEGVVSAMATDGTRTVLNAQTPEDAFADAVGAES